MIINGIFSIQFTPQLDDEIDAGRMLFKKIYSGDLSGESEGQMLSKRTVVENSAAYVAMETFTGTLNNLKGSISLYHTGVMDRGLNTLSVKIVPDSGTEELAGISGTMTIKVEAGEHSYQLEYEIE